MTEQKKKIDSVADAVYYYMVELQSQVVILRDIGLDKECEELRSITDELNRFGISLLNRKGKRRRS